MIEPFGSILEQYAPALTELGFRRVSQQSHVHAFVSEHARIEFNVDKYVPSDIVLHFVSSGGERYPLWQISQLVDMPGYNCDKRTLDGIKRHYGLPDGAQGQAQFDIGVKIYASTYLEQALRFLSRHGPQINVDSKDFGKALAKA